MARKGGRQSTSPECMIHAQPALPAAELGSTGVRSLTRASGCSRRCVSELAVCRLRLSWCRDAAGK